MESIEHIPARLLPRIIGARKDGTPIWSVAGGRQTDTTDTQGGSNGSGGAGSADAGAGQGGAAADSGARTGGAADQSAGSGAAGGAGADGAGSSQGGQADSGGAGSPGAGQGGSGQDGKRVEDLPDWAQALIKQTNADAAKHRKSAQTVQEQHQAMLNQIAVALGVKKDETPPDPKVLAEELNLTRAESKQLRTELAVFQRATSLGANAGALLDSRSFVEAVGKLDPKADDFGTNLEAAIKAAVQRNPLLAGSGQAPAASSTDGTGGPGSGAAQGSPESMSIEDHRKRLRKGRGL